MLRRVGKGQTCFGGVGGGVRLGKVRLGLFDVFKVQQALIGELGIDEFGYLG